MVHFFLHQAKGICALLFLPIQDIQTNIASYVMRHTKFNLCLKTLAMFSVAITPKS